MPIPMAASLLLGVISVTTPPPADRPQLIVLIAVDQLRADYLGRWARQWTGGFRRLWEQGVVYLQGMQDHAVTETATGHATLLSGRYPAHNGIVSNSFGVGDSSAALLEGGGPGASPRRFEGTTLVDWLRARQPDTRFLSVAAKDRSAILPIGRLRGPVFWYAGGRFLTSRYYGTALPSWVVSYNRREGGATLAGRRWELLLPDTAYAETDAEPYENGGQATTFPHPLPADPAAAAQALTNFPWMDSLTLDFALEGAGVLGLGRRATVDLLVVGLGATDVIGHTYGPDSREIHDHMLRLDRWLGWFFDSLAATVPRERIMVVLTSDHGVTPFPERSRREGRRAGRLGQEVGAILREANQALAKRTGGGAGRLTATSGLITGDLARLSAAGIDLDSLATSLARRLVALDGVAAAYTPVALRGAPPSDAQAARWKRTLPAGFPWLVGAVARPGYIWSGLDRSTTHGTTNRDDVLVPIAFLGDGLVSARVSRPVRTVDIAPTLAKRLGVRPLEPVDGVALPEVAGP